MKSQARVARARAASFERASHDKVQVADSLSSRETRGRIRDAVKPASVSGTMRKAGAAMMLSPDPLTDIPALMLIGASYIMKRKDPAGLESVARETRRLMAEFESFL